MVELRAELLEGLARKKKMRTSGVDDVMNIRRQLPCHPVRGEENSAAVEQVQAPSWPWT